MSSRWKKVWADFWGNRARTILTIVTIAVGAFAVGFNSNLSLYLTESMDGDFLSAAPSEAQIYAYPMDDDMLKMARAVPGVNAVEGRSTLYAKIARWRRLAGRGQVIHRRPPIVFYCDQLSEDH